MGRPVLLAALASAVVLAGCTAGGPPAGPAPAVASASPKATSTTPAPKGPATVRFGHAQHWPGGLSVRVSAPKVFIPSTWVRTVTSFDRFLAVTVRVRNGTGKTFDLSGFEADGRASGKAADPLYDPGKLGPAPPAKLKKNATAVFRLGFGVAKRKGFTLQITPAPGMDPALCTG